MNVSDEERREAERIGELVGKKLMEIMDLQAEIDALVRDKHPTPFGSQNWQFACLEALQRIVAATAIQFLLFEPANMVKGNDELRVVAEKMLQLIAAQVKTLQTKKEDW